MPKDNALLALRKYLDISQRDFADLMDVSQGMISLWERDRRAMNAETTLRFWAKNKQLFRALGYDCEDLLWIGRGD